MAAGSNSEVINKRVIEDLNTVANLLLQRFPELRGRVEASFGSYYNLEKELPGPYAVFEDVLRDMVIECLDANDGAAFLSGIFGFLEEMANSSNPGITDLLRIAILESLVASRELLTRAWGYMGKKMRELARETARVTGHSQNLPLGENQAGNGH